MNRFDEKTSDRSRPRRLDALVAVLLGLGLLLIGAVDVRSYHAGRSKARREFPLLTRPGDVRLGNVELYRGSFALVEFDNIGQIENDRVRNYRHALGPESAIEISAERTHARLFFTLHNPIEGQAVTVSLNGQTLEQITDIPVGELRKTYAFPLRSGINRFVLAFARANGAGAALTATDDRPIAGTFFELELTLD